LKGGFFLPKLKGTTVYIAEETRKAIDDIRKNLGYNMSFNSYVLKALKIQIEIDKKGSV
jgi:hypothetical protein